MDASVRRPKGSPGSARLETVVAALAVGGQVDVHLDRDFNVLEAKPAGPGDERTPADR